MRAGPGEALLVIDMLNDFVLAGAPLEVPDARGIVAAIAARISRAHEDGVPVIYVCDAHTDDDPEFEVWPRHAVRGSRGARVIDELAPRENDTVVAKTTYSAFYGSELEECLGRLGASKLTLVGVLTNVCILFTAADAVMRGFRVEAARDGVAALTGEEHAFALSQMEKVLEVKLV
jgi:nicotinamidase-related amidase